MAAEWRRSRAAASVFILSSESITVALEPSVLPPCPSVAPCLITLACQSNVAQLVAAIFLPKIFLPSRREFVSALRASWYSDHWGHPPVAHATGRGCVGPPGLGADGFAGPLLADVFQPRTKNQEPRTKNPIPVSPFTLPRPQFFCPQFFSLFQPSRQKRPSAPQRPNPTPYALRATRFASAATSAPTPAHEAAGLLALWPYAASAAT